MYVIQVDVANVLSADGVCVDMRVELILCEHDGCENCFAELSSSNLEGYCHRCEYCFCQECAIDKLYCPYCIDDYEDESSERVS